MNNEEKILAALERHDQQFERIDQQFKGLQEILSQVVETQARMQETQSQMQTELTRVAKNQDQMQQQLDDVVKTQNEMRTELTRVALTQENTVARGLNVLREGHKTLLETLAPKEDVDALKETQEILQGAVRNLSQDVQALKAAK